MIPYVEAIAMLFVACLIAGLAAAMRMETRRIGRPVFIDDLCRWYACKEFLSIGDAVKLCVFMLFIFLILYAGQLVWTYFPQTNILKFRPQRLGMIPTPVVINHHWATTGAYYIFMWPVTFIALNDFTKYAFKHSERARDLANAIEVHPTLSKLMSEKSVKDGIEKKVYRFQFDQIAPDYVILRHWSAATYREIKAEKERFENAGNLDILWLSEIRHGEIHFKLRSAELLARDDEFFERADGSLVRRESARKRYTYFFQVHDTIKIGGGNDPRERLAACQTFVALPKVLAYCDDDIISETEARRLFKAYRLKELNGEKVKGDEIFQRHPRILEFIEDGLANGTFKRFEE